MSPPQQRFIDRLQTPIGELIIITDDTFRLLMVGFTDGHPRVDALLQSFRSDDRVPLVSMVDPGGISSALASYFVGEVSSIDALAVAATGTEFEHSVWSELRKIPSGTTCSYSQIATKVNRPKASRAIGMANGKNPIAIVVPCHRVIGANGALTGYAGGVERKLWLLRHEGYRVPGTQLTFSGT